MASNGKTVLVAAKALTIESRPIPAGTVLASIEHEVDVGRLLSGLQNGAVVEQGEFNRRAKASEPPRQTPAPAATR